MTVKQIHGILCRSENAVVDSPKDTLSPFFSGFLLGLLVGEGHFGGDGKQPQITLRMHVRHEALLRWIDANVPAGKLYGPYNHGGREYFQWIARGKPLKDFLIPLLDSLPLSAIDPHTYERYKAMKDRYKL
jgi:hypothetical protein